jgi:hypothetical protein
MKISKIEELVSRYYDGTTSEEEENALRQALKETEELPPHLVAERAFFHQLDACRPSSKVPEGLEERLKQSIDRRSRRLRLRWIGSIAATALLLFSVGTYLYRPLPSPALQDTYTSPQEAYAEAQKALLTLANTLNKGIESVEQMQRETAKAHAEVINQLSRINQIK